MKLTGWKRVLALVLVVLASFAAVESATCADDFGACCEVDCCGCVHAGVTVEAPSAQPYLSVSAPSYRVFQAAPSWAADPLFHPPIA